MFREQEHPRDNQGKFTFKNGKNSNTKTLENLAQVLYGKKTKEEKLQKEKRNKLLDKLKDKLTPAQILYSSNKELENMANKKGGITGGASSVGNSKYVRPVEGKIISNFGPRNTTVGSKIYKGIDIKVPIGTPVKTISGGKVYKAGASQGYGIAVFVDHGIINGKHVTSEYGHLSKCNVKVGDIVKPGQVVAKSGNTGRSEGPHLHVTIKENDIPIDPRKYLE